MEYFMNAYNFILVSKLMHSGLIYLSISIKDKSNNDETTVTEQLENINWEVLASNTEAIELLNSAIISEV